MPRQPPHVDPASVSRALVVLLGGIGNMVMFAPALAALRRLLPGARITLMAEPFKSEQVLEPCGLYDELITFDKRYNGVLERARMALRMRPQRYDLLFVGSGTNPLGGAMLGVLGGVPIRVGEARGPFGRLYNVRVPYEPGLHEVLAHRRLAEAAGAHVDGEPFVCLSDDDRAWAEGFLTGCGLGERRPLLAIHPGCKTQFPQKRWPAERFAAVARAASESGAGVYIVGGPADAEAVAGVQAALPQPLPDASFGSTVRQMAAVVGRADVLLSNDSGPMHIAAAQGVPCVALFGPTDPARFGPWGQGHTVIRASVSCAPCYRGRDVACAQADCMKSIAVDEVVAAVTDVLARTRGGG